MSCPPKFEPTCFELRMVCTFVPPNVCQHINLIEFAIVALLANKLIPPESLYLGTVCKLSVRKIYIVHTVRDQRHGIDVILIFLFR